MEIFGIGLPEIVFILLLVVIIIGPKDLEKMARNIGGGISRFLKSDTYQDIRRIGQLPNELAHKAGLDDFRETITSTKVTRPEDPVPAVPSQTVPKNPEKTEPENRIAPPSLGGENKP